MSEKIKKTVELPLLEPIYSTYHYQGGNTALIVGNPSIRNHFLNKVMNLICNRKFLYGYTTPELTIVGSKYTENPYLESRNIYTQYLGTATNTVIKNLLDDGWYVNFVGVDDYYVKGKSWYHERHFIHDGMVCGYDDEKLTFTLYAYDSAWVYRKFETSQRCFEAARKAAAEDISYGFICGYKPKKDKVQLDPKLVCIGLKEYLASSFEKYPPTVNENAYGIVVMDYIVMYIDKLKDGSIPHERMDRRILRLIWEHKKVMLERLQAVEDKLGMDKLSSFKYEPLVKLADDMRMLYAAYHMKQRQSLLPTIREKLVTLRKKEAEILGEFVTKLEAKLK